MDDNVQNVRDCNEEYPQPLSAFTSRVRNEESKCAVFPLCPYSLEKLSDDLFLANVERQAEEHIQSRPVLSAGRERNHQGRKDHGQGELLTHLSDHEGRQDVIF